MKKILMIILPLAFFVSLFIVFYFNRTKISSPSISLPSMMLPTQTPIPTPTPVVPGSLSEIDNDLKLISQDLGKVIEDTRFTPPSFIFSLGLPK